MRLLRIYSRWITVLLLIVTFGSVLHAPPFKNINHESAGAAHGSESSTGRPPTVFQLDREAIVLERLEMPSSSAPISSVTFSNIFQDNVTNFAASVECHCLDLLQRQHTLRI